MNSFGTFGGARVIRGGSDVCLSRGSSIMEYAGIMGLAPSK